ncbi:MAG: aminomethyl-transferring glycine dehydrogenase [Chlorobi bacterium]|nr:aminomethyl-transferring glycine dehydrogenase [Chlorobiota bacterium]
MQPDLFYRRHIGPHDRDISYMLEKIGVKSLDELIDKTIPSDIRLKESFQIDAVDEYEYLNQIREITAGNKIFKSFIGLGYYGTVFPAVIQRNILENPSWYTSYTPYQAEISQGRLEALLNFQTMIIDLTGLPVANSSLLDEATAAAEAMLMLFHARSREQVKAGTNKFFVDENLFPQTLDVLKTRAGVRGIDLITGPYGTTVLSPEFFGAIVQYPDANGEIHHYSSRVEDMHKMNIRVVVVADILSLVLLTPPGEWGADAVVGSVQRMGLPMGYGGPHAGYFAAREEFKRYFPGRIIGVSRDIHGNPALRMALQTREQHIKRDRATSNICTAQALLATMAGMYAVYHGPEGLKRIALNIHLLAAGLNDSLKRLGYIQENKNFFDTLKIAIPDQSLKEKIRQLTLDAGINLNFFTEGYILISTDETTREADIELLAGIFARAKGKTGIDVSFPDKFVFEENFTRKTPFLQHKVFNSYHAETDMMRYIKKLERKDISLTHSMISLGSCTMKLNAASEMLPLSWPEWTGLHPFVPQDQAEGYHRLMKELGDDLLKITEFDGITFQPNSGAAGEHTGLMMIRRYLDSRGEKHRNVVLIPASAHGTNPASAVMAGMKVVMVPCDDQGNINVEVLRQLAGEHKDNLAAFMVTYPSTHGVFESRIREMSDIIHKYGGQVYMDGANMNAQVGLTSPKRIGADVCHLNLHKTFAIPHGGGGPGVGPVAVAKHIKEFLPGHPVVKTGGIHASTAVAAAPWGSASILVISHAYIKMMGSKGLTKASKVSILSANYISARLCEDFPTLFTGETGFVGHELILDCREFKHETGITETDIAKRLMDYGYHAPTLSFPVHGTLMVEPTESESLEELDRFISSMKEIRREIEDVKIGRADQNDNVLKYAPHTQEDVVSDHWEHNYSREKAAFPLAWVRENKFWPVTGRVDDAWGDRHLLCSCNGFEQVMSAAAEE